MDKTLGVMKYNVSPVDVVPCGYEPQNKNIMREPYLFHLRL